MTTIQGPQHRTAIKGPPHWYPIPLALRYKATSNRGLVRGFGQTRMMSNEDIIFTSDDGLEPGMSAEVALDWPRLLGGSTRLQLVLQVTITSSQDGVAEARIWTHDFRTRRSGGGTRLLTHPADPSGQSSRITS